MKLQIILIAALILWVIAISTAKFIWWFFN